MKTKNSKSPTSLTARDSLRQLSALARELAEKGRYREAAATIEHLFATPRLQGECSAALLDEARDLFTTCQRELLEQNHPAAVQAAAELLIETEKLAARPIRVAIEDDANESGVQLAWNHGCDHHLVVCQREPEKLQPYKLASALLRIQSESEALLAGKSRFPTVSRQQIDNLLSLFDPLEAQRLVAQEGLWITLNPHPDEIALVPLNLLLASAIFMLIDARLRLRYSVLRPAQFLARSTAFHEAWKANEDRTTVPPSQRIRERTLNALDGLHGLFLDSLFGGVTDFALRYNNVDGFDLAQALWRRWQSRFPAMEPGDEFALLDEFAEILGLSGSFSWTTVPFAAVGKPKPQSDEAAGL